MALSQSGFLFYIIGVFKHSVLIDSSSETVVCNPNYLAQVPEVKRKDKREDELS